MRRIRNVSENTENQTEIQTDDQTMQEIADENGKKVH